MKAPKMLRFGPTSLKVYLALINSTIFNTMQTTMTKRFKRDRWHPVRVQMDDMQPGQILAHPCEGNYTAAQQAAHSLRAAYLGERVWLVKKNGDNFTVERTK